MSHLDVITDVLIILGVIFWVYEKTGVKFVFVEKMKSKFGVKTHKTNILNEYRLQRYDKFVDEIENIITKELSAEYKILNQLYAKMVLSAPDETLKAFLEETKSRLDSTTRNRIYYQLRKELQPDTKLDIREIEAKFYDKPRS